MRRINLEKIAPAIIENTANNAITPASIMMTLNYIGSLLGLETALGISGAHAEIRTLVEWFIDRLEPVEDPA